MKFEITTCSFRKLAQGAREIALDAPAVFREGAMSSLG